MTGEYRSLERQLWDEALPVKQFVSAAIKGFYGTVVTPFRIPTFLRKIENSETMNPLEGRLYESLASLGGMFAGAMIDGSIFNRVKVSYNSGDYVPLAIFLVANALSLSFEIGKYIGEKRTRGKR